MPVTERAVSKRVALKYSKATVTFIVYVTLSREPCPMKIMHGFQVCEP